MPKLITSESRTITGSLPSKGICVSTYDEYKSRREIQPDVPAENIQELTRNFKEKISTPIRILNPSIEMGDYFVIPVDELQEMLTSGDQPDFIHVCNALRDTTNKETGSTVTFPVVILVPVKKATDADGVEAHEVCKSTDSVYIEAYPCPPDPKCPKTINELKGTILDANFKLNTFKSLIR